MSYIATKIGAKFQVSTYTNDYQITTLSVSSLNDGGCAIIWQEEGSNYATYGQVYNREGAKFGTKFPISGYDPSISSLSDDGFIVTYCNIGIGICGQVYNSEGIISGAEFQISTNYSSTATSVESFNDGGFVVTYNTDEGLYGQPYNAEVVKSDNEFQIDTVGYNPSVSSFSDGGFVVIYSNNEGLYGQVYKSAREKSGTKFQVNTYASYDQSATSVSSLSDDEFVVTWQINYVIQGQLYNREGVKVGIAFQVNNYNPSLSSLSDNGFVLTYSNYGGVYGQLYNITGIKSGTEFQVDTAGYNPSVASFSDDKFIVTWLSSNQQDDGRYGIYGQLYRISDPIKCTHYSASLDSLKPYDLAVLSLKVYADPADSGVALPNGWQSSVSSDDAGVSKKGYFARIYIKDDTAIIAQRGTENKGDDFFSDAQLFFDEVSQQFSPAKDFFDYATSYLCNTTSVSYIAFSGHSLGAALAELSSAKFKFSAITFESPGTREILKAHSADFPSDAISYVDSNVITYNAAPNLVNTMAEHVGSINRVYPSVDSMLIGERASKTPAIYPFYAWDYSIQGQHKIRGIVNIFDSNTEEPKVIGAQEPWPHGTIIGYNGFDHYKSYYTNPYYWNSVVSYKTQDVDGYITSWFDKFQIAIRESTLSVPKVGVNITGDNTGNIIWGTTSFADRIAAGTDDDVHYMYQGDDYSIDTGGANKYIIPVGIQGKKIIEDTTKTGSIWLYNEQFSGDAIPVLKSLCPTVPVGAYYLNLKKAGSYYITEQGADLFIAADCATTTPELQNTLTLKNFVWGDFTINKYLNNDKAVIVGSNGDDYLDCSLYKALVKKCFINALAGEDTLVTEVGQDVVLVGHDIGNKVFKLLDAQEDNSRKSLQSSQSTLINIVGIKEGDVLDLSELTDLTSTSFTQNGTHMQIDLGNDNIIIAEIAMGNSFVDFNLADGIVTVNDQNMTQVLADAGIIMSNGTIIGVTSNSTLPPVPPTPQDSNSWLIPTIVAASSVVAVAIIGVVGRHYYNSYKAGNGYSLMEDIP